MRGTAARLARWLEQGSPVSVAVPASGPAAGVPILTQQFGDLLHLVVEVAWGANLAADPGTWVWTDITRHVRYNQKVVIKQGRPDEASTPPPATCAFTVLNTSGAYSKGPQSANYPYVRKGTPVRVRTVYRGAATTRFQGQAVSWLPEWDTSGNYAVVHVEADGTKRRLNQGAEVLQSTLRRAIPGLSSVVAYWPCEDGNLTGRLTSGLPGGAPLAISGTPNLASYTGFACSKPIPTFANDSWSVSVPSYPDSGSGQVRFLLATPTTAPADQAVIVGLSTAGTIARIELRYALFAPFADLRLIGFDRTGATVFDSGIIGFSLNGLLGRMSVQWVNTGGNVNLTFSFVGVGAPVGAYSNITATGQTLKGVTNLSFAPGGNLANVALGQIYVQNAADDIFTLNGQLNAFSGESPTGRLARLCAEQGETIEVFGLSGQVMGPQLPDTFVNLLEACAVVDQGYLFDGLGPGLGYFPRDTLENQPIILPLRADLGQIEQPVSPVDDDQLIVNQFTANRQNGATVTYTDTTGPLKVATAGAYTGSATVNCQYDGALLDVASWRVHLGNQDAYRYPTLNLALHHHPELLSYWLVDLETAFVLAGRVEVTGLSTVRKQQASAPIRLFAEGWQETIDQFTWSIAMNASFYEPWRIITLAADVGDTTPTLCRLDTDGSTTVGDTPAGSTAVTVNTTSGPLWVEGAGDDFPLDVSMNGWQVTVSSIADGIPNTTFETGLTGWTAVGCTAVQSSTRAHSGAFSAQITPDGVSTQGDLQSGLVPVVGGATYTAKGWVWFTNPTTNFSMSIIWLDATGTFISTSNNLTTVPAGRWINVASPFQAPGNAATGSLAAFLFGTPPVSQVWWLDDVSLSIPQVFTLANPTVADIPAGSPVSVWLPTYLTM